MTGQGSPAPDNGWEWACLDTRPLQRGEPENLEELIEAAEASFAQHPIDHPDRLEFARSFLDGRNGNSVLVLDTFLLSDTEVIYVFDPDGRMVEYFARSTWLSAKRDNPPSAAYRAECR